MHDMNAYTKAPRGHAHGSRGCTVHRTAYTLESDAIFLIAAEQLINRYVHSWRNYGPSSSFGALPKERT